MPQDHHFHLEGIKKKSHLKNRQKITQTRIHLNEPLIFKGDLLVSGRVHLYSYFQKGEPMVFIVQLKEIPDQIGVD